MTTYEMSAQTVPAMGEANNEHITSRKILCGVLLSTMALVGCGSSEQLSTNNDPIVTTGTEAPKPSAIPTTETLPAITTSTGPEVSVNDTDFRNFTFLADTCDYATQPWNVKNGTATQELPNHYSAKLDVKTVEFGDVNGDQKPDAVILNDCALLRDSSKQLVSIFSAEGTEVKRIGLIQVPESKLATNASVDADGGIRIHEFNGSSLVYNLDGTPKEQPTTTTPEIIDQPNEANKISVDGIGPLQIGMDTSEVEAKGYTFGPACGPYRSVTAKDGSSMMARLSEDDHIIGLSVDSPSFSTLSNVKVGDPESLVNSTYGKNSTVTDGTYPGSKLYRFASPQAKENNIEILFYVNGTLKTISLVAIGGEPLFC